LANDSVAHVLLAEIDFPSFGVDWNGTDVREITGTLDYRFYGGRIDRD
jgi:hypothetical protein